ncbi:glycosyltransferase family 4 protein [Flavobacterium sp.]|uniref:glycosyltransferase family 4 protein n=1 Tax=Flavobacterium sp. TaxID=239 RepID=UPI003BCAF7E4
MKLLYITNGIKGAAGLERVLSIKASYLVDVLGYEVHILMLNNNNAKLFYEFSSKIILHDVIVNGNPFQYIRKYIYGIKATVKKINPDVISVCDDGLKGFFIPKLISNRIPIIYERHVSKVIELGIKPSFIKKVKLFFKFLIMNYLAKSFDKFILLTKDTISEWNIKNSKVIPNPLSFFSINSALLDNKKVIAVGKQGIQKGYDRLLHSWKIVQENHPDWELSIYGKFDPKSNLVSLSKQLNIENSVHFYKPVKNIKDKYRESSIFAFSSRFEGFGMVLIEAMALGVPCVSFDCPFGPSSIIKDNEDGFLVTNGDADAFAEKLMVLIQNKDMRKLMGGTAKENVKQYLPETIMPQWDKLFKELTQ